MAFQLSPGVNVSEIDLTTIVPSVPTSIGAFAGPFAWGPVGVVTTISDEVRLADTFGKPDSTVYEYWFSAANFLAYSSNLKIVRAANTTTTLNATANASGILIKNQDDYTSNRETATNTTYGPWAAKYAGALGNSLRISVCPSTQAYSANLTVTDNMRSNAASIGDTVININGTATANANVTAGDLISVDNGSTYIRAASVNATAIVLSTAISTAVTANTPILRKWQYSGDFGVADRRSFSASHPANIPQGFSSRHPRQPAGEARERESGPGRQEAGSGGQNRRGHSHVAAGSFQESGRP
jgi:hypothetical protein